MLIILLRVGNNRRSQTVWINSLFWLPYQTDRNGLGQCCCNRKYEASPKNETIVYCTIHYSHLKYNSLHFGNLYFQNKSNSLLS